MLWSTSANAGLYVALALVIPWVAPNLNHGTIILITVCLSAASCLAILGWFDVTQSDA